MQTKWCTIEQNKSKDGSREANPSDATSYPTHNDQENLETMDPVPLPSHELLYGRQWFYMTTTKFW